MDWEQEKDEKNGQIYSNQGKKKKLSKLISWQGNQKKNH